MTRNQPNFCMLVPKLQLGNAGLEAPASRPASRSLSFVYWVPKLELGNQHSQHNDCPHKLSRVVGAGHARDEAAKNLYSLRKYRGHGPLLQIHDQLKPFLDSRS